MENPDSAPIDTTSFKWAPVLVSDLSDYQLDVAATLSILCLPLKKYSSSWVAIGPIIEEYRPALTPLKDGRWRAKIGWAKAEAATAPRAIMEALVISRSIRRDGKTFKPRDILTWEPPEYESLGKGRHATKLWEMMDHQRRRDKDHAGEY